VLGPPPGPLRVFNYFTLRWVNPHGGRLALRPTHKARVRILTWPLRTRSQGLEAALGP